MFLSHWCFFVWACLAASWRPSVSVLYGTRLVSPVTNNSKDHRGVSAPLLEEFENEIP